MKMNDDTIHAAISCELSIPVTFIKSLNNMKLSLHQSYAFLHILRVFGFDAHINFLSLWNDAAACFSNEFGPFPTILTTRANFKAVWRHTSDS